MKLNIAKRMRRLRGSQWIRDLCQEHRLVSHDLVLPIFVCEGNNISENINAMPDIYRHSVDKACEIVRQAADLGICAVAPFAYIPIAKRNEMASEASSSDNVIARFCHAVKKMNLNIGIITDPALDPFTNHGHDGILRNGEIVNDESVARIVEVALAQAQAGADIISPSDMMDGRIKAIRDCLDSNGFENIPILSYAAKFASAFYGPYREAVGTDKTLQGDKATYYINSANSREALADVCLDIAENADMVMIKPALPYLDIIRQVADNTTCPVFAYQVSGEYAAICAASKNGWLDGEKAMLESLLAIKRAGATGIFTYFALTFALAITAKL